MSVKTIDIEQLLMLHAFVLASTGGGDGIRDIGRLEAAIATQTQEVFGTELYGSIYEKSAAMVRGIVADHPFVDGNKRTAMLVGFTLMKINGIKFDLTSKQLEDFAVQVAVERLGVEETAKWLEEYSQNEK